MDIPIRNQLGDVLN